MPFHAAGKTTTKPVGYGIPEKFHADYPPPHKILVVIDPKLLATLLCLGKPYIH